MVIGPIIIAYNTDVASTSNYVVSTCIIASSSVVTTLDESWCYQTQYIPMWKASDGYSIIQSPHDLYTSYQEAQDKLPKYPLNVALQCMCDFSKSSDTYIFPNVSYQLFCQIYSRCFIDVATVKDIQANIYQLTLGMILTAIGYGALGLSLVIHARLGYSFVAEMHVGVIIQEFNKMILHIFVFSTRKYNATRIDPSFHFS